MKAFISASFLRFSILCVLLGYVLPMPTSYGQPGHSRKPAPIPATVVTSWLTLQLKIGQTTPAPPPVLLRKCAYTGIALYESVVPGLPGYQSIAPQLTGLRELPHSAENTTYYWPASANAAMAEITRSLYPMTSAANKASIDSLEAANLAGYHQNSTDTELSRSSEFGKSIATAIFNWSKTDGNDDKTPYQMPAENGSYLPTPPRKRAASLTNWGKNRQLISGSDAGVDAEKPVPYSTDTASAYYAQVREVYDISQNLTPEQKTIALFWADDPDGKSWSGGHWLYILNQTLLHEQSDLETAAVATARLGIVCYESTISIFKGKYRYHGLRPVTYIQTVMNKADWHTLIDTPPHPEFPSGHALVSSAAAQTLTSIFGADYAYSDSSYTALGFSPRRYHSFEEAAIEAANSRVYGGIHYQKTCDAGLKQGKTIARNIAEKLKFKRS